MKFTHLVTLTALLVPYVYASPQATPSGIPGTSALPSALPTTFTFDTTGALSILSELSSLISSESIALSSPLTSIFPSSPTASSGGTNTSSVSATPASSAATVATTTTTTTTPVTTLPTTVIASSSLPAVASTTASTTSGAHSLRDMNLRSSVIAGVVLGAAVAALV
ncbi:hypothetical protein J3R82DRAFT_9011 [Butyriboletus roseoflavus]|nr:hypothetical protein J3R82DRAFT_9011 [Butyriboletus roseoflavus]